MATRSVKKSTTKKSVAKKKTTRKSPVKKGPAKKRTTRKSPAKKSVAKKKVAKKNKKLTARSPAKTGNKIVLNSVLAVNDAKTLYTELGNMLEARKDILIDASAVEMVDSAILQLLSAFINKAQLGGPGVTWVKPSKEFLSRSETLDLTDMLGLKGKQG